MQIQRTARSVYRALPQKARDALEWATVSAFGPYLRRVSVSHVPVWLSTLSGIAAPNAARRARAAEPTTRGGANINILFELLDRTKHVPGDVAECGVFRGRTFVPMGIYLEQQGFDKDLLGLDSFEGFSNAEVLHERSLGEVEDVEKHEGGFSNTSLQHVAHKIAAVRLSRAKLVPGYFEHTLAKYADRRFSFVHLDCDVYDAYRTCLEFFYPRLSPGAVVLLDEYNDPPWPGCNKAVDEFLSDKAEKLAEIARDNFRKWYFCRAS
jgi:hypothetical protein